MENIAVLLALVLALWFWQDSLRARELATDACRRACRYYQVQFLDATVSFGALGWRRNQAGRMRLLRTYVFSFSRDGTDRQQGYIVLLGRHVETVHLPPESEFI